MKPTAIEDFLQNIIEFCQKFFSTFYSILFKPKKFLADLLLEKNENYIRSYIFFILNLFIFITISISMQNSPRDSLSFLIGSADRIINLTLYEKILYIFPIAVVTTIFISLISKFLRVKEEISVRFKRFYYYYSSASLLLFIILYSFVSFFFPSEFFSSGDFNSLGEITVTLWLALRIFLVTTVYIICVSIIAINSHYKVNTGNWYKFLIVSLISSGAVFLFTMSDLLSG